MTGYTRRDALTALALLVLALALGAGAMDIGHVWGDDFAGYLLEGRAIAQGRLEEQAQLNAILHPSERAFGGRREEGPLVYALGLPALRPLRRDGRRLRCRPRHGPLVAADDRQHRRRLRAAHCLARHRLCLAAHA